MADLRTLPLVLINVVLLVAGQILWKRASAAGLGGALTSPAFWVGLGLYGVATILWLEVLRRLPLSLAYPLQALAYPAGVAAAFVLLHEPVPASRWVGVAVIVAGVGLVGWR